MYPEITSIEPILAAIEGLQEIRVLPQPEGFQSVDYLFVQPNTFGRTDSADPQLVLQAQLRRECRGIKFDMDGQLIARPYPKFFNLNQHPETQAGVVDWTQPHDVLDKLDGSMVHPIPLNGGITMTTRKTVGDVAPKAQHWMERVSGRPYIGFCREMLATGMTPIFEWCSKTQPIVLRHTHDDAIITGIRNTRTGVFVSYDDMVYLGRQAGLPVVARLNAPVSDIAAFAEYVRTLVGAEGHVLRFHQSGWMIKFKGEDYLNRTGILESIAHETIILNSVLSNTDDDLMPVLEPIHQAALARYATCVRERLLATETQLRGWANLALDGVSDPKAERKRIYGVVKVHVPQAWIGPVMGIIDGQAPDAVVLKAVQKSVFTQTRLDGFRAAWNGPVWADFLT